MWGGNGLKRKFSLQNIFELTRKERERSNPEPFDFAPFDFAVRLRLRITPRSHPSTSSANLEPRSRLQLCRDRTPRSHRDGTDRSDRTEIAIEKWLGFDEFDRIWWIFFVGFCFCAYLLRNGIIYLFGSWENVRKMWGTRRKCVFYIIFSNTTKH